MKKLYAILTSLFVMLAAAVPAHAVEMWVYGNINGNDQWGNAQFMHATEYVSNKFAVELNITQTSYFRISDNGGGTRYFAPKDNDNKDMEMSVGNTTYYTQKNNNIDQGKAFKVTPGHYILLAEYYPGGNDWGLQLKEFQPYLFGNFNGTDKWKDPNKNQVKLNKSGNEYSASLNITSDSYFKLVNGDNLFYTCNDTNNDQTMADGQTYDARRIGNSGDGKAFMLTPGQWTLTATNNSDIDKWQIKAVKQTFIAPDKEITLQEDLLPKGDFEPVKFKYDAATGNYVATAVFGNQNHHWFRIKYNGKYYHPNGDSKLNSGDTANGVAADNDQQSVWRFNSPATYIFTITKIDDNNITFKVEALPSNYYLSGNVNGWMKLVRNDGDKSEKVSLEKMAPYMMQPCADKAGWYVLDFAGIGNGKMFGQFQILKDGNFRSNHWYLTDGETIDWNATFSESESSPSNMATSVDKNGKNLHLAHNYYKNAKVYFNPTTNQGYIVGEPEDLYVYYYSDTNPDGDLDVTIGADSENHHNYWTNDDIRKAKFEKVTDKNVLAAIAANDPVINDLKEYLDANPQNTGNLYRYRVAPGLCQQYYADNQEFFFNFKVNGADQKILPSTSTHSLLGENHYFINYNLPAIFVQVVDHIGVTHKVGDVANGSILNSASIRYITIDENGTPKYLNAGGEMVDNMYSAEEFPITDGKVFDVEGTPEAIYKNGIWNHEVIASKAGNDEPWREGVKSVSVANASRYFEIQIDLQNGDNKYTLYFSDFVHNADGTLKRPEVATANYQLSHQDKPVILSVHHDALTGVADITADDSADSPAVFYNLQGVRVANPTAGQIYIKVTSAGSEKVIF